MKKLYGITCAMVTPMDENGGVLFNELSRLTEYLIKKNISCLYPAGTTGEMLLLNLEDRKEIAETVVNSARGRVPVYVHVGAMNQSDTIALAKHALNCGADGVGIVTPAYFKIKDNEMVEYYVEIANTLPPEFPVYLYNIPQCSGNDLKKDVCNNILLRTKNIIGVKYSWMDMGRTLDYINLNKGEFSVMHGGEKFLIPLMELGCDGIVTGTSCVYPEPFVNAYKAYINGEDEAAKAYMKQVDEIGNILKNGTDMAYYKAALTKRTGINAGSVKKPLLDIKGEELEKLYNKMDMFDKTYGY